MQSDQIAQTLLKMAAERGNDKTICPSEVARALYPTDWRKHMEEVRAAAVELQKENKVQITQKGAPVDGENLKGPIRIKIKP